MIAKLLALLGIGLSAPPDDSEVRRQIKRATAASLQHNRFAGRATASALSIYHEIEADRRPAEMLKDSEAMTRTVERNAETTVDAIVREMQGR